MKKWLTFVLVFGTKLAHADPLLDSWLTSTSGQYARIFPTIEDETAGNSVTTWNRGQGVQNLPTYAGVHEISHDATNIYIRTTGLGAHIMGPWYGNEAKTNLFPNYPSNQAIIYRLPRTPGPPPGTKTNTGLGRIGIFVDGVSMFDSRDAFSYDTSEGRDESPMTPPQVDGNDVWNRDAYVNEGVTFDASNAHQGGSNYHYHANPPGLRHLLGDSVDYDPATNRYTENFNGQHSPIIGWVRDGYPLYGPYGYSDPNDPNSTVRRMISGFRKRNITVRETLPPHAARDQNRSETLTSDFFGPPVSTQFVLGHYLEDYEYLGDFGQTLGTDFDLDEHNGRFCITPEFPAGTYAYFVSIEADGTPKFPYNIGRKFYGTPQGNTTNNVPAGATTIFQGGPETPLTCGLDVTNDVVTLTWSTLEGGLYLTQSSPDLEDWQTDTATQDANALSIIEPASDPKKFYRTSLLSLSPFDDAGFQYTPPTPTTQNNVLLIIVDDWGIDASPLDNPTGANLASMPNFVNLATQGVRFTNAYAQPQCSPTRAGILSGRFSFRHGIGSPGGANFPVGETSLPDAFANASSPHAVSMIGKWHLGGGDNGPFDNAAWPDARVALSNIPSYTLWDKTINGTTTTGVTTYATTDQADDAINFINTQNNNSNPWFCWLAFNAPHGPFHDPPSELIPSGLTGTTNSIRYRKALEAMDTEIGNVLQAVDLSTTNVIIIGDNGTPGQVFQAPFLAQKVKGSLYEGGVRVPLIVAGPDVYARGTRDDLVHCADLFPTILDLAGVDNNTAIPADTDLDGISLLPALTGNSATPRTILVENFGAGVTNPGRALRQNQYKLHIYDDGTEEFYDVVQDISETNNLLLGTLNPEQQQAYDDLVAESSNLQNQGGGNTTATGILNVSPNTSTVGSTITVTINLDPNKTDPAVPGINQTINRVTLGGVTATSSSRPSRYVVEATFTLPNTPGSYAMEVVFNGPQARTFGLNDAFEVTP